MPIIEDWTLIASYKDLYMKIMVFLHGTTIMHKNAINRTRDQRVKQVLEGDESICDFESYVPVGNAVGKLQIWHSQGAEIVYLSSHQKAENVEKDKVVLRDNNFPPGLVYFRERGEGYNQVVERILPEILVEDDCESIGGEKEMAYPNIKSGSKERIKSIVVKEFGGIDHLPNDISSLVRYHNSLG